MSHTIIYRHITQKEPSLGRHVEHDERSRAFAVTAEPPAQLTDIYWEDHAPILDQGHLGACVGFTGADILNTNWATKIRTTPIHYFTNKDGIAFYEAATHTDNIAGQYPPNDTGSSGLGLAKALKKAGYIKNYEHAFTWQHITAAITTAPLAIGSLWTYTMMKPDQHGIIHVGPLDDTNIAGGHEWMLRGINYTRGLALGRNHWNKTWDTANDPIKQPGEFWIPISELQPLLLDNQGDMTLFHLT